MRKWLRNLRTEYNLSQTEVASRMNLKQQYYQLIESGKRQKDLDMSLIVKISEIFDVPVEWIIEQEKGGKHA